MDAVSGSDWSCVEIWSLYCTGKLVLLVAFLGGPESTPNGVFAPNLRYRYRCLSSLFSCASGPMSRSNCFTLTSNIFRSLTTVQRYGFFCDSACGSACAPLLKTLRLLLLLLLMLLLLLLMLQPLRTELAVRCVVADSILRKKRPPEAITSCTIRTATSCFSLWLCAVAYLRYRCATICLSRAFPAFSVIGAPRPINTSLGPTEVTTMSSSSFPSYADDGFLVRWFCGSDIWWQRCGGV